MVTEPKKLRSSTGASQSPDKRKSIGTGPDQPPLDDGPATKKQKLPVRGKDTVHSSHKSVSMEVSISKLSEQAKVVQEIGDSQEEGDEDEDEEDSVASSDEEVFKTPIERKHIIFGDDDRDEFVTPLKRPAKNMPGNVVAQTESEENEAEEEEGDDDDAPEAVSSHQAAAQSLKLAQIAAEAAKA